MAHFLKTVFFLSIAGWVNAMAATDAIDSIDIDIPHVREVSSDFSGIDITITSSMIDTGLTAANNAFDICVYDNNPSLGYKVTVSGTYGVAGQGLIALQDGAGDNDADAKMIYSVQVTPPGLPPVTLTQASNSATFTGYDIPTSLDCSGVGEDTHYSLLVSSNEFRDKIADVYRGNLTITVSDPI